MVFERARLVVVTEQGFLVRPRATRHYEQVTRDPFDTPDPTAVVVRWRALARIAAVEPWPSISVTYWFDGGEAEVRMPPRGANVETFARDVDALFAMVERHKPRVIVRGWLDVPEVPWERAEALPSTTAKTDGAGAFRTAARVAHDVVIAARPAPSPWEHLVLWLRGAGAAAVTVELTAEHVWARRPDRTVWRLPLASLRRRGETSPLVRRYVFGRRTELALTERPGCAVCAELDRKLGT